MNMSEFENDGTITIPHNAPLNHNAPRVPQLGDTTIVQGGEPLLRSDTTESGKTDLVLGSEVDSAVAGRALAANSPGTSPAIYPLTEKLFLADARALSQTDFVNEFSNALWSVAGYAAPVYIVATGNTTKVFRTLDGAYSQLQSDGEGTSHLVEQGSDEAARLGLVAANTDAPAGHVFSEDASRAIRYYIDRKDAAGGDYTEISGIVGHEVKPGVEVTPADVAKLVAAYDQLPDGNSVKLVPQTRDTPADTGNFSEQTDAEKDAYRNEK